MSDVASKVFGGTLGSTVLVELKGNRCIRGKLYSFDQHMNLVLEEAEEITSENEARRLGTIVVRGDNIVLVSPPPSKD
jgi:small nuclear ribonucleoprotein